MTIVVGSHHHPAVKLLQIIVVAGLVCCLLYYLSCSVAKYREGVVAVETWVEPNRLFQFPTVCICADVAVMLPVDNLRPWVARVRQNYYVGKKDRGKQVYVVGTCHKSGISRYT